MTRSVHLMVVAFAGTARHLRATHGLPDADIDADDPHGLAHDHAVLHGAVVREDGRYRFPPEEAE